MNRIDVALGERSYPIFIGSDLLRETEALLAPQLRRERVVVVTDERVWSLAGRQLAEGLGSHDLVPLFVPEGEQAKSWQSLIRLIDALAEQQVERGDHIIAFGGGAIGDIAGFAAAILKRGCAYVQIPTTLLAQVDSSVGGKTAINIAAGKNLVGAFHQPSAVLIDIAVLESLPERELRAGYAEVVKYGLIGDPAFFAWCEANGARLIGGDGEARLHAIETSVRAKAAIVAEDERETSGRRALLNLGHTFGHALEAEAGYGNALLHGEAVALGLALAFRFSAAHGLCSRDDAERVERHLRGAGLPTRIGETGLATGGERLVEHMLHDKKRADGRLPFILVRGIGAAFVDRDVEMEEVTRFLDEETR